MSNRQTAVLAVLILSVGGFLTARQFAPDPPAPPRYEYLPFIKNAGVFRVDRQTGEVRLFLYQEGELVELNDSTASAASVASVASVAAVGPFRPSPLVDYEALGLDPETGEVVDFDLFNRALRERGLSDE